MCVSASVTIIGVSLYFVLVDKWYNIPGVLNDLDFQMSEMKKQLQNANEWFAIIRFGDVDLVFSNWKRLAKTSKMLKNTFRLHIQIKHQQISWKESQDSSHARSNT